VKWSKKQAKKVSLAALTTAAMCAPVSEQVFIDSPTKHEILSFFLVNCGEVGSMLNDASVELDEALLEDYENGDNNMDDEGTEEGKDNDGDDEVDEIDAAKWEVIWDRGGSKWWPGWCMDHHEIST
jgi:hypothetical protein